jgi:hypothetical protein
LGQIRITDRHTAIPRARAPDPPSSSRPPGSSPSSWPAIPHLHGRHKAKHHNITWQRQNQPTRMSRLGKGKRIEGEEDFAHLRAETRRRARSSTASPSSRQPGGHTHGSKIEESHARLVDPYSWAEWTRRFRTAEKREYLGISRGDHGGGDELGTGAPGSRLAAGRPEAVKQAPHPLPLTSSPRPPPRAPNLRDSCGAEISSASRSCACAQWQAGRARFKASGGGGRGGFRNLKSERRRRSR